jgi:diguanylate cyclase (GGDEF)-like protein
VILSAIWDPYVVNWSTLPDIAAVALLTFAFGSVARRGQTAVSSLWLIAWVMIALHFTALMFAPAPGVWGTIASVIAFDALAWAGLLFMWACVPFRDRTSSRSMLIALLATNSLYIALITTAPQPAWLMVPAASLYGALPVVLAVVSFRRHGFTHPLRSAVVLLQCALTVFLLAVQMHGANGIDLATNAVFFTVYLGCVIYFWYAYRRHTAGAFITLAGFSAWALVFVIAPAMERMFPALHVQSEVWNLPKYVVAFGMILLLLEDQIEHNKYLALHDDLTGLPNRRLFQDRLASALERARRGGSRAALLLIDLDRFKDVNDTVGHHVGDLLLRRVSEICLGRMRRSDTVARTGGDEFSVILEDPTSREDAARIGRQLTALLEEPQDLGGHIVSIGASVGVSVFPDDANDAEALCIAADRQMYADKSERTAMAGASGPRWHRIQSTRR